MSTKGSTERGCGTDSGLTAPLNQPVTPGHIAPGGAFAPVGTDSGLTTPIPVRLIERTDLMESVDSPLSTRRS